MSYPEIYVAFSTDDINHSNVFLVPSNISNKEIAAWMMGYSKLWSVECSGCKGLLLALP